MRMIVNQSALDDDVLFFGSKVIDAACPMSFGLSKPVVSRITGSRTRICFVSCPIAGGATATRATCATCMTPPHPIAEVKLIYVVSNFLVADPS